MHEHEPADEHEQATEEVSDGPDAGSPNGRATDEAPTEDTPAAVDAPDLPGTDDDGPDEVDPRYR